MKFFSPTAFGSLNLAFKLEKGNKVSLDFVGSLLNSPSTGRFQRLHFHVYKRRLNYSVLLKLIEAINMETFEIKGRPWCENLLPFLEEKDHPAIVHSNSEMIFVKDRFPKVNKQDYWKFNNNFIREVFIICVYRGRGLTLGGI